MPALSGEAAVKAHCLPFSQIPHTTRLFTDFLAYSPSVRSFYPQSPYFKDWMKQQVSGLQYGPARRDKVSLILERQNSSWNASSQTVKNIERLRNGAAAVVTGQQVGLFGGPMFTLYKALSAVKLAEEAAAAGIDAVPVFWLATSDHDLAEVNHVSVLGSDGALHNLSTPAHGAAGAPVSEVRLGDEILPVVEEAAVLLGDSQVSQFLREAYQPGESLGTAFARLFARLFASQGVILLDASDPDLHRIAAPMYRAAVERSADLSAALLARGEAIENAGYYQQVKVTPSSVLLFTIHEGTRTPIHRLASSQDKDQEFMIGGETGGEKISAEELVHRIDERPEKFSPNVLLRPVVQDYLLPTLAYAGGAAEIAYFAQAGVVYEQCLGRVTPIVPRFSATIVEPKAQRWLRQYDVSLPDAFCDAAALRQKLAGRTLPEGVQAGFDAAEQSLQTSLAQLRKSLEKLDSTLVGASQTAESKIHHQLDRLRQLASAAELRRSEVLGRHAQAMSDALYPGGALQERGVAGIYFLARHGTALLQTIYDAMHTDCHDHQILEI
jgi:bacillithiol synthase